jgi:hypothetical protein
LQPLLENYFLLSIRKGWRWFLELGDGSKIKFWYDVWCREMALKEAFPDLYNVALVKDAFVAVNLDSSSGSFW